VQRTVRVEGETLRLRTRWRTMVGNRVGIRVSVEDSEFGTRRYHVNMFDHEAAMDYALVRHLKETRGDTAFVATTRSAELLNRAEVHAQRMRT